MSYHNGSVWPHRRRLCAAGFARYGFHAEARRVRQTRSSSSPPANPTGGSPDCVAGYERDELAPVPYPVACPARAWAAAALVHVLRYARGD